MPWSSISLPYCQTGLHHDRTCFRPQHSEASNRYRNLGPGVGPSFPRLGFCWGERLLLGGEAFPALFFYDDYHYYFLRGVWGKIWLISLCGRSYLQDKASALTYLIRQVYFYLTMFSLTKRPIYVFRPQLLGSAAFYGFLTPWYCKASACRWCPSRFCCLLVGGGGCFRQFFDKNKNIKSSTLPFSKFLFLFLCLSSGFC